jgi:hypothetical protein
LPASQKVSFSDEFISKVRHHIEYLNQENVFIIKTDGDMTGEGFIIMAEEILNHLQYKTDNNVLFDRRELNFENVTIPDLEMIRKFHVKNENIIGNGRSALVVNDQSQWNNLWDKGEKIKTANIVRVFDDFDSALRWIKE